MNTDRLLTRVFDKQEKKMMHPNENSFKYKVHDFEEESTYIFKGICGVGLLCSCNGFFYFIPFGDRFIPMQCTGLKDCDGELVYESDIINSIYYGIDEAPHAITRGVIKEVDGCFDVYLDGEFICELFDLKGYKTFNGRGNIHENPELMEKSEC